jgi:hypothetical protein
MINKFRFPHNLIARRLGAVILAATALTGLTMATASPTRADWTEERGGCSLTCHWYLASGTCTGPFGVRVPCPLKKKRCSTDYCTRTDY